MTNDLQILLNIAIKNGVEISGIEPTTLAGRGIGMTASRYINKNDVIMKIPIKTIKSLHNVSKNISQRLPQNMTIHGLLAAELTLHPETVENLPLARPSNEQLEATLPIFWPEELQNHLPTEAKHLVSRQCMRFETDWQMFQKAFQGQSRECFFYSWMTISTRAFYFETSATLKFPWHDRLALLPLADLFNHGNEGCFVTFSTDCYTITADRAYHAGEELCASYGNHPNDYLLAEYGFLLPGNQYDRICLDELIMPKLSLLQSSELKQNGYLGEFMLHSNSRAHENTWIALRLLCSTTCNWQNFIDGEEDAGGSLEKATALLPIVLDEYLGMVDQNLKLFRSLSIGNPCAIAMLVHRWEQIRSLVVNLKDVDWFTW